MTIITDNCGKTCRTVIFNFSIIFLLGCEKPTDDFEEVMEKLYTLDDFKKSIRFVLNIEDEFPYEVSYKFTGNEDNIVNAKDSHILKKMMINTIKSNKGMSIMVS